MVGLSASLFKGAARGCPLGRFISDQRVVILVLAFASAVVFLPGLSGDLLLWDDDISLLFTPQDQARGPSAISETKLAYAPAADGRPQKALQILRDDLQSSWEPAAALARNLQAMDK